MSQTKARAGLLAVATMMIGTLAWAAAPAGRYTVNEQAGTVLDNKTGLTWQRAVPDRTYNWADAQTYCQELNLGGFSSGWRLPTRLELETLVDVRASSPVIDVTAFPATPAKHFWTSSLLAGGTLSAWYLHFDDGSTGDYGTFYTLRVRCVR